MEKLVTGLTVPAASRKHRRSGSRLVRLLAAGLLAPLAYLPAVAQAAGGAEPPIAATGDVGAYFGFLHDRVHEKWAGFISKLDPADQPSKPERRRVTLSIVASPDGLVTTVKPTRPSAVDKLERMAMFMIRESAPWPDVPKAVLADDGLAYIEWTFAWDDDLCSGLKLGVKPAPLKEIVPQLLSQNRDADAWARVQEGAERNPESVLSWAAQVWLARALNDPATANTAAIGLLSIDDRTGLKVIEEMLRRGAPETPRLAALMVKAHIPVCPLVSENLTKGRPQQELALAALGVGRLEKECVAGVGALLEDQKAPVPLRMTALKLLQKNPSVPGQAAIDNVQNDPSPVVRGASMSAILATIGPGAGKAIIYKAVAMLKDPIAEVRAAAYALIVRVGGDAQLDQIYMLFKEHDPLPYEKVAAELGKVATPASGQFLGKLLRKDDQRIRVAAAQALAARTDATARELAASLANDPDPAVKAALAGNAGKPGAVASAPEPYATSKELLAMPVAQARKVYQQIVGGRGRASAGQWLLASFSQLDAPTRSEVLGEWLAGGAAGAVAAK